MNNILVLSLVQPLPVVPQQLHWILGPPGAYYDSAKYSTWLLLANPKGKHRIADLAQTCGLLGKTQWA